MTTTYAIEQIETENGQRYVIAINGSSEYSSIYISREWAERAIAEMIATVRRDEEYRASPEYAAWVKSMAPNPSELAESIRHFMHEQGDLA